MKKVRIIAFLMLLAMLVPTIIACKGNTSDPQTTGTVDTQTGDPTKDPEIPTGVRYDGYEFTFLVGSNVSTCPHIFESDANNEDAVVRAIYERNEKIEQEYGIKITEDHRIIDSTAGNGASYQAIQKAYESEDTLFDAAVASGYDCGTLAQSNFIVNLRNYGYIKLDKAWWDQAANEQLTIGGATYFTSGDISYIDDNFTYALIFNKDLAKAYNMPDFYKLVEEGKWTYDQLYTFSKQGTKLDNVDGYSDGDYVGFLGYVDTTWMSFSSIGAKIASVNADGEIELTLYDEKNFDMFDTWTEFGQSESFVNWQLDAGAKKAGGWKPIYQSGKALFFGATIDGIYKLRDTETDYGFLPWPKYNEEQKLYHSGIAPNHISLFCIPNVGDEEHINRTSTLVVALSVESNIITEAFYKKNLEGKSVRDDESYKTLDIIFANRVYDLGYYYNVGSYRAKMFTNFRDGISGLASVYSQNEIAAKTLIVQINKLYKAVAEQAS